MSTPCLFRWGRYAVLMFIFFIFFEKNATAQPAWIRDSLDLVVRKAMLDEKVPGLALAVIKDGKVVLQRTYGRRERDAEGDVDDNTLFMIGSNSKAYTATALAMLEYEGKLALNDKVTKWMPDFKLYDENVTRLVSLRDLLCHRLGTKTFQGDFTFWGSTLTRHEVIGKMSALKPMGDFRANFGYCNAAFLTAGEVIPLATGGTTWEDYIRIRFFKPLDMTRALALAADMRIANNAARPHATYDGRQFTLSYPNIDNLAPAGSISLSINDMTHWLLMQMDTGRYAGRQVIPQKVILQTWNAQTIVSPRTGYAYGLGWFISYPDGVKMLDHTGGVDGFLSASAFLPEERLGVIILTNTDNNALYSSLRDQLLKEYRSKPGPNLIAPATAAWITQEKAFSDELMVYYEKGNKAKRQQSFLFERYVGKYTHPVYGEVEVKLENNRLRLYLSHHPQGTAWLDYLEPHTFLCTFGTPTLGIHPLVFKTNGTDAIGLTLKVNDFIEYDKYEFEKVR
jgi:CubicO group peptidase (beta-lactamase class C family)